MQLCILFGLYLSGEEECDCSDKEICYDAESGTCPDCEKLTKGSLPTCDIPLKYNDVMIVATEQAFLYSVPIGGFAHAMAKKKLKIAINTTRQEGGFCACVSSVHCFSVCLIKICSLSGVCGVGGVWGRDR